MLKIDILGFWGGYPTRGGATPGYLISTPEGQVLLDCGSGVMSKLSLKSRVENLSGVVLSHLHYDHTADIGVLQYAVNGALRTGKMTDKISIYGPPEPIPMWEQLQSKQSDNIPVRESDKLSIAGMDIEFHAVNHTIPCFAVKFSYRGKMFVYSADTTYLDSLIDFAVGADVFLCEATICEGSTHTAGPGHMNAREAAMIAKKANVGKLVLTHLPSDGDFALMKQQATEVFGEEALLASEIDTITVD